LRERPAIPLGIAGLFFEGDRALYRSEEVIIYGYTNRKRWMKDCKSGGEILQIAGRELSTLQKLIRPIPHNFSSYRYAIQHQQHGTPFRGWHAFCLKGDEGKAYETKIKVGPFRESAVVTDVAAWCAVAHHRADFPSARLS
jgi:hypothetical protein